jgi:hypothetical protein
MKAIAQSVAVNKRPVANKGKARQSRLNRRVPVEPRRSGRISGEKIVDYCEVDEHDRCVRVATGEPGDMPEGLLDLMGEPKACVCSSQPSVTHQSCKRLQQSTINPASAHMHIAHVLPLCTADPMQLVPAAKHMAPRARRRLL